MVFIRLCALSLTLSIPLLVCCMCVLIIIIMAMCVLIKMQLLLTRKAKKGKDFFTIQEYFFWCCKFRFYVKIRKKPFGHELASTIYLIHELVGFVQWKKSQYISSIIILVGPNQTAIRPARLSVHILIIILFSCLTNYNYLFIFIQVIYPINQSSTC